MYKEKVCSVVMTLRLFRMAQLNYIFSSDLKTQVLMASEVVRGHLRPFNYKLLFAGHGQGEGLLHGYNT